MNKKLCLILLFTFSFATEKTDFMQVLNKVNIYANNTQLNLDKAPKNLDIIDRDFIINSGARTLVEVLQYLPGVEIARNSAGKIQIIVRGNKSRYRDKIKFLINGIDVTNSVYNNQFYFYNFPAKLIKRIEFSKTPDAVMYGENAFLGVINIITVENYTKNFFNFNVSNKKSSMAVGFNKYKNFTIDYHYLISDPNIQKTTSQLFNFQNHSLINYRSTTPDEFEKNAGLGIVYKKNKNILRYRIEYYKYGGFYGVENLIPIKKDKNSKTYFQYLDFHNHSGINDNFTNDFHIGLNNFSGKGEYREYPYDFNTTIDNNPDNDIIIGAKIKEISFYMKNILTYTSLKHLTNLILFLKHTAPYDYEMYNYIPSKKIKNSNPFLQKNNKRDIFAIGFQDLYSINDNLSFIYGYRYDHYSDFGSNNSYKIGSVYSLNKDTIFKLLFNNAFRAPSLIEYYSNFYGNKNLKPEKINMLEFIWLQKIFSKDKLKITLYSGINKKFIGRYSTDNGFIYKNLGDYDVKGIEGEYHKQFKNDIFDISYSYNNNKAHFSYNLGNINYYSYSYTRKRMLKTYNIYKFNKKTSLFISSIYGSKIKIPFVKDVNEYFTINGNLKYVNKNYSLMFGINNLTNHKNYDVALPNTLINNQYIFTTQDGRLPKIGREIYFDITKKW